MKNKYLVFLYTDYYPFGGLEDFWGGANDIEGVRAVVAKFFASPDGMRKKGSLTDTFGTYGFECSVLCTETGGFFSLDSLDSELVSVGNEEMGFVEAEPEHDDPEPIAKKQVPKIPVIPSAWSAVTGELTPIADIGKETLMTDH